MSRRFNDRSRDRSREKSRDRSTAYKPRRYDSPPSVPQLNRSRSNSRVRPNRDHSPERPRQRRPKVIPNQVIGVFGLRDSTTEEFILDTFSSTGQIKKIHMVTDVKTKLFRGFCFITYKHLADATDAIERFNGEEVNGRKIRVDYSETSRAHSPTPGYFKGERVQRSRHEDRPRNDHHRERSPERRSRPSHHTRNQDEDRFKRSGRY